MTPVERSNLRSEYNALCLEQAGAEHQALMSKDEGVKHLSSLYALLLSIAVEDMREQYNL